MLTFLVVYYLIGIIYVIVSCFIHMQNEEEKQSIVNLWLKIKSALKSDCNLSVKGIVMILLLLSFAVPVVGLVLITWPWWMVAEFLEKKPKQGNI
ncbi:hypothetical protein AHR05_004685 [Salmonella enterica subsp. salamae]|nr:hypothetical protein [Salmonella enterica subsp. salamae]